MKHFVQNLYSFHFFRMEWGVVEGEVKGEGGIELKTERHGQTSTSSLIISSA